jgi:NAD(P)-binding Rossmann-like domain
LLRPRRIEAATPRQARAECSDCPAAMSCFRCGPPRNGEAPPAAARPVRITYTLGPAGSAPVTEEFDFLVVACDPRALNIADCTDLENEVKAQLRSFTFFTSLFSATRPNHAEISSANPAQRAHVPNYAVRFHPQSLEAMTGQMYAFRDEVMVRERNTPDVTGKTFVVTYQLDGRPLLGRSPEQARQEYTSVRDATLATAKEETEKGRYGWIDFNPLSHLSDNGSGFAPDETQLADYFPHFAGQGLSASLPWAIRESQGDNSTLYVSSFTCFESVLHCYLYGEWLMRDDGKVMRDKFPKDRNARIAICGAGPSGLLFASQHLLKKGYTNFTIFESTDRYGGKTLTIRKRAPGSGRTIPCELGTCYLSASYAPMMHLFKDYDAGTIEVLDAVPTAQAIYDPQIAQSEEEHEDGIPIQTWVLRKNDTNPLVAEVELGLAVVRYIAIHYLTMGTFINDAMPEHPPGESSWLNRIEKLFARARRLDIGKGALQTRESDSHVTAASFNSALREVSGGHHHVVGPRGGGGNGLQRFDADRDVLKPLLHSGAGTKVSKESIRSACNDLFHMSFEAFLRKHEMQSLIYTFTYSYEIQGYGTLSKVPAYYGLIWMTPSIFWGAISTTLFERDPAKKGQTKLPSRGWLELWDQIVRKHDLLPMIKFQANISSIQRNALHTH